MHLSHSYAKVEEVGSLMAHLSEFLPCTERCTCLADKGLCKEDVIDSAPLS